MNVATRISVLFVGVFGLAACEAPGAPFAFSTTYNSFGDIETAFAASTAALVEADGDLIDNDDISQVADFDVMADGTAIYDGAIIAKEVDDGSTLIGQLQIEVAFATDTMDGRAGNFINSVDGALTGTLLGNTTFVRTVGVDLEEDNFEMELTGALSGNGEAYDATITLQGNFLNGVSDIESVAGDADLDFGPTGPAFEEGAFAATR